MKTFNNYAFILTGQLGAGKSMAAQYISKKNNYQRLSFVEEIWIPILKKRNLELSRSNLQNLGIELMKDPGPNQIVNLLLEKALSQNRIVIDDVRRTDVFYIINELCLGTFLVYIDVDFSIRFPRLKIRDKIKNKLDQQKAELVETETTIPDLKKIANLIINNSRDIDHFYKQLDEAYLLAEKHFNNEQ